MSNKMAKREEKPFEFPEKLLHSIGECSAGGFVLLTINEFGNITPHVAFDSEVAARSMISYMEDFAKSFREVNTQNIFNSMVESSDEDGENLEL